MGAGWARVATPVALLRRAAIRHAGSAQKAAARHRLADGLLLVAAALAWTEVGSGAFEDLWAHVAREGMGVPLQASALALVLAVVLRTALLPVHGWIVQVMEAPTPVSALLHAGVVNLGGFALIRFAPMLEHATTARVVLVVFGLATAVLAGLVMLTRVSIKVRLAWSTVAQMGFMVLECGLGLYTLAALHLIGHSLYKAHAFLSASTVVRETRIGLMHPAWAPTLLGVLLAPALLCCRGGGNGLAAGCKRMAVVVERLARLRSGAAAVALRPARRISSPRTSTRWPGWQWLRV